MQVEKIQVRFSGMKPSEPSPRVRFSYSWNTVLSSTRLGI